jgi:hypothetical protein
VTAGGGNTRTVFAVAGATGVTVISACLRAAAVAGFRTTLVLLPTTAAGAAAVVVEVVAVDAVELEVVLLELLPHAATTSVVARRAGTAEILRRRLS